MIKFCDSTNTTGIISNSTAQNGIWILPNPASDELTIQSSSNIESINIYDLAGQKIYESELNTRHAILTTKINIRNFSKGIYFVEVSDRNEKTVKKFVKE